MAKSDWWFKFEHLKWLTDEQLNRCSLETQGFWMRCICMMRKGDSGKIEGTAAELSRLLSVTPAEFKKCFSELNLTKTASVTQTSGIFTIMSRKFTKELKVREQNRLRKARERRHAAVTPLSQDKVKSKSKELEKKEEEEEAVKPLVRKAAARSRDERTDHPAIQAMRLVTNRYPDKVVWNKLIEELGVPDLDLLTRCYVEWVARGFKPTNLAWAFEWYKNGIPEKQGNGTNRQNNTKQTPAEIIASRPYYD